MDEEGTVTTDNPAVEQILPVEPSNTTNTDVTDTSNEVKPANQESGSTTVEASVTKEKTTEDTPNIITNEQTQPVDDSEKSKEPETKGSVSEDKSETTPRSPSHTTPKELSESSKNTEKKETSSERRHSYDKEHKKYDEKGRRYHDYHSSDYYDRYYDSRSSKYDRRIPEYAGMKRDRYSDKYYDYYSHHHHPMYPSSSSSSRSHRYGDWPVPPMSYPSEYYARDRAYYESRYGDSYAAAAYDRSRDRLYRDDHPHKDDRHYRDYHRSRDSYRSERSGTKSPERREGEDSSSSSSSRRGSRGGSKHRDSESSSSSSHSASVDPSSTTTSSGSGSGSGRESPSRSRLTGDKRKYSPDRPPSSSSADHDSSQASKRAKTTGWDAGSGGSSAEEPRGTSTTTTTTSSSNTGSSSNNTATVDEAVLAGIEQAQKFAQEQKYKQSLQQEQFRTQQKLVQQQMQLQNVMTEQAMKCRIYVGSIPYEGVTEQDIRDAFSSLGEVTNVNHCLEPTGRSRGFCFVDFATPQSASLAIQTMNGYILKGRAIKVGPPVVNMPIQHGGSAPPVMLGKWSSTFPSSSGYMAPQSLVGGTGSSFSSQSMMSVAASGVHHPSSLSSHHHHHSHPAAAAAHLSNSSGGMMMNSGTSAVMGGFHAQSIPRTRIYVGSVNYDLTAAEIRPLFSPYGTIVSCQLLPNPETGKHKGFGFIEYSTVDAAERAITAMDGFLIGGRNLKVGPASNSQHAGAFSQAVSAVPTAMVQPMKRAEDLLSKEEDMTISSSERYMLMQKLARSDNLSANQSCKTIGLRNMAAASDIDDDLEEEVTSECSKFGPVERVVLYQVPNSTEVVVYVAFATVEGATSAVQGLDKRWFARRSIAAGFAPNPPAEVAAALKR